MNCDSGKALCLMEGVEGANAEVVRWFVGSHDTITMISCCNVARILCLIDITIHWGIQQYVVT